MIEHHLVRVRLRPCNPEFNPIGFVWKQDKHHWRCFATWTGQRLLTDEGGSEFKTSFS